MRAQFADRRKWVTCSECQGRSFSDPTKPYHYPRCSSYAAWRFAGDNRYYSVKEQVLHERALKATGHGCSCFNDESRYPCDYCSWHYDQEDEG